MLTRGARLSTVFARGIQLRNFGADVIELPTIRIEPPTDLRAFAQLVQDAHAYDWIVFTSPNGVNAPKPRVRVGDN